MPKEIFRNKPTLAGHHVLLRPFAPEDLDAMGVALSDPEVLRLTGSVRTSEEASDASEELEERERRWYESREEQGDRLDLAVIDRQSDKCVGEVVLNEWSALDRSCNFRILLGPTGRNRGLGSVATRLILDYAFGATELNRIELDVYDSNPPAQHVYEAAGFIHEGRKREAFRFDNQPVDVVMMSILRSGWEAMSRS